MQRDNQTSDRASPQGKELGLETSSSSVASSNAIETIMDGDMVDVPEADIPTSSLIPDPSSTSTSSSDFPEAYEEAIERDGDGEPSSDDEPPDWKGGLPRARPEAKQSGPKIQKATSTSKNSESRAPPKSVTKPSAGKSTSSATNKTLKPVTGQTTTDSVGRAT